MPLFKEQVEYINTLSLNPGERKTLNCPFCSGQKKFTVTHTNNKILWNCFKASCNAKGAISVGYSIEILKSQNFKQPTFKNSREIPEILSNPLNHKNIVTYLHCNNCYKAFINRLVNVKYDPIEDRVLFISPDGKLAVGRSLTKKYPKWLTYGNSEEIFTVGNSDIGILVEDVPSACAVATNGFTGIALLGTSIKATQMSQLKQFSKLIIALDKDASKTAIRLSTKITHPNITVRFLEEDLKAMEESEVSKVLA